MKETKEVIALVNDNGGSYLSLGIRLAQDYKKVYYCNPSWIDAYPMINKSQIGVGYDEITVIDNIWDVYNEIDFGFSLIVIMGLK